VIKADGSLTLALDDGSLALVTGRLQAPATVRRVRRGTPDKSLWLGQSFEGADGGLRGFSSRADDDGDGRVDEDPLDGLDNDGDGRVDEDFAAVSDAMTTVRLSEAGSALHFEFYHWRDVRLTGAVMLSLPPRDTGGLLGEAYQIDSGAGAWREISLSMPCHSLSGKLETVTGAALVAQDDGLGGSGLWLGVMDLGAGTESYRDRPVLDGAGLTFSLSDTRRLVAVCVAESRLQLERLLLETGRIAHGVADPATGREVPWIVGPACVACRLGTAPQISWRETDSGQAALVVRVSAEGPALVDPDLLKLNGEALGLPLTLGWQPDTGVPFERSWSAVKASDPAWPQPYTGMAGLLDHGSAGDLVLTLPLTAADLDARLLTTDTEPHLSGLWLDGRPFNLVAPRTLTRLADTEPALVPEDEARPVDLGDPNYGQDRLNLSLGLLEGWPNPFRDVIQIRFKVPSTVGEAFDWSEKEILPQ